MTFVKNFLYNLFFIFLGKSFFWILMALMILLKPLDQQKAYLLFLNLKISISAFLPTLILNAFVSPYKRGFYCDDESIRYPKLKGEKVPTFLLVFLITVPSVMLVGVEVRWTT